MSQPPKKEDKPRVLQPAASDKESPEMASAPDRDWAAMNVSEGQYKL